jgi:hypothetical protein
MSQSRIKIVGLARTKQKIKRRRKSITNAVMKGVDAEMQEIFTQSQQLVPVLTGALKRSGKHAGPKLSPERRHIVDKISYGDSDNVNYAVIVHENLEVNHRNGSAKYLQIPRNKVVEGIGKRIGARVGKILKR